MCKRVLRLCMFLPLIMAGMIFLFHHNPSTKGLIPCPMHALTGLFCPGCGAARALYHLLHLEFYTAFRYNSLLVILLPFFAVYFVLRICEYIRNGYLLPKSRKFNMLLIIIFAVLLVYGILRNINLYPLTLLRPTGV